MNLKSAPAIFLSSHSQEHIYNYVLYDIDEWKGPTWNKLCLLYRTADYVENYYICVDMHVHHLLHVDRIQLQIESCM